MKRKIQFPILLGAIAALSLSACNDDTMETPVQQEQKAESLKPEQPNGLEKVCYYVDNNWSSSSVLLTSLQNSTDTNFMNSQMTKIASMWGRSNPTLRFVNDPSNFNSTYNAISYSTGKIYYGYAIYYDAKAKGGDIVNAMILAHEYGHQLQYIFGLPTVTESTARPNELEADGFAGYYLRRPNGYNQTSFTQIAAAYEFAQSIGDYQTTSPGHHGTPAQRRSAVRLGFLLGQYSLTAADFDYNFFYYYQGVLNGTYKMAKNTQYPELDAYMQQYLEELKQIQTGEISAEEFKNLK
ncbi:MULTISPECIES: metalloprotease [Chryseobacterium]|uniref:Metalloprotease n=2 Tax=Chryseobacterium TaxID=59732 RepID=A0AAJ1R560_9FLAO|nr:MULTISPECIES: metalloprotease [Chryseobacterium]MCF2220949.1 metalloprotease [Chryseobacterium sp. PS-8]MDN4014231.1 metalloprotease [Chryseobacterium gambrini]MDN4029721.1 metalloprotease [Chryseobacterium gambrini]QWA37143.1 metalloprotease [Chryseobacterium sp. ZHDP1]